MFASNIAYVHIRMENERSIHRPPTAGPPPAAGFVSTVHRYGHYILGWYHIPPNTCRGSFSALERAVAAGIDTVQTTASNFVIRYAPGDWEVIRLECSTPGCLAFALTETNFSELYDSTDHYIIRAVIDRTAQGNRNEWQHQAAEPYHAWDCELPLQRDPNGMPAHWLSGMLDVLYTRVARLERAAHPPDKSLPDSRSLPS